MSSQPISNVTIKLSYNTERYVPRNFFVHVQNMLSDMQVCIEYDGEEISTTRIDDGYIRASFRVVEDKSITLKLLQGVEVVASTAYIVHENKIFEVVFGYHRPKIIQTTVGSFG